MALRIFLLVSGASVFGAVLWLVMRWPTGSIGHVAGAAMIVSGAFAAAGPLSRAAGPMRAAVAALGVCLIGAVAEIAGLYWGFFGAYAYTDFWQPSVYLPGGLVFPLLLPVAWFVILAACYSYARQRLGSPAAVFAGALVATLTDLVAEAVLTGPVGFWVWLEPAPLLGAPIWNPVGWFVTALLGCSWVALITGARNPIGNEPVWMLSGALIGTAVIGATHSELRGLWSLVLLVPLLAWRARSLSPVRDEGTV